MEEAQAEATANDGAGEEENEGAPGALTRQAVVNLERALQAVGLGG